MARHASIALISVLCFAAGSAHAASKVALKPGDDVPTIVKNSPSGTTFVFAPGEYRIDTIVAKDNDAFEADGEVILTGAQLLQPRRSPDGWTASVGTLPEHIQPDHCLKDHPFCWQLRDVFVDNVLQTPVESPGELRPGRVFYDEAKASIVLGADSAGHKVEISTTPVAFTGPAENVRITGLIVEKFATLPQRGAIGNLTDGAKSWTLDHVEARWNHGTGVAVGSGSHVLNCKLNHNGQKGAQAHGENVLIEHNEIAYNNYAGYHHSWEAGGTKFVKTVGLVVRDNDVHDNVGAGLWTDIDNIHTTYEGNRVYNNTGDGIKHEISYDAVIRNNLVTNNGAEVQSHWLWGAQIMVQNSWNVQVYGNQVKVPSGANGIVIINQRRGDGAYGPHIASGNQVHDNTIVYQSSTGYSGFADDTHTLVDPKNVFENNHYSGASGRHWFCNGAKSFDEFRMTGFDRHGSWNR
ncbi:MAG TPA: right-handed parallel beta-helix repeat-containing protein [Candidatus Koribacter sp.]|jgi:parallel beta-helix repeat protein